MKPLLVGELNPYGADPAYALYPLPPGSAGARLHDMLGLSIGAYLRGFDRVNLCLGKWSAGAARAHARVIAVQVQYEVIVLLGRKVTDAFGVQWKPFSRLGRYVVVPHPSGRNRAWNEPGAATMLRELVLPLLRGSEALKGLAEERRYLTR